MISNINFTFAPLQDEFNFSPQSQGHEGFIQATKNMRDFVLDEILNYQHQANLKPEEMQIMLHGQSRGSGLGTLTAIYLRDIFPPVTSIFVLNHAPLPLFNSQAHTECDQKLNKKNILNFICEEDGVLKLIERTIGNKFERAGTDIPFSATNYPDFNNRVGQYTHLSNKFLKVPLSLFGIDAKGWEGHMPETYFHSSDAFKDYKQKSLS